MIISLLVAMDEKRGIGKAGGLPWRLSSDMKRFRELTMGHHIMVGRKTFESIGKGCFIAHSISDAISFARERGESELFVCGGAEIYAQTLSAADRLYLTLVHADCDADTFFTEWNSDDWIEMESEHRTS
nr:Dihydrofolate reductase [uncultured bacterium]